MSPRIVGGIGEIVAPYDGLILDLWGVVHDGNEPYPGVIDALERLKAAGKPVVLLSNAPRRAAPIAQRLTEIGVPAALYRAIHSSGEEVWQHLKRRDEPFYAALGRRCYLIGPERDEGMLEGLDLARERDVAAAEFILNTGPWGWDETTAGYEPVLQAARAHDLPMVCANADLVVVHGGRRVICAGALAERYEALGGRVRWHGKPFPSVYAACLGLLGVTDRRRILAIGDSLRTDIAGARGAGIDSIWIVGGIHAEELGLAPGESLEHARIAAALERSGEVPLAVAAGLRW
ncbi:MAG TPA: TIGR01459 family HAD-type hydrolase [Stellaceae bacterium]|nr:TIGR01459 family HAD-type hydrolase [Stellaceae bacterium]